jgi:hypothetical protein
MNYTLASQVIFYWNTLIPWLQKVAELLVVA